MVQGREAGSWMLRNSGSTLHGSAPPQCDGRTITRLCYGEQGSSSDLPKLDSRKFGAWRLSRREVSSFKFLVSSLPIGCQLSQGEKKRGRDKVAQIHGHHTTA